MEGHGSKLAHCREQFVAALLTTGSVEQAGAAVGVSRETAFAWVRDPQTRALLKASRAELLDGVVAQLKSAGMDAVRALRAELTAERPADRIQAAKALLSLLLGSRCYRVLHPEGFGSEVDSARRQAEEAAEWEKKWADLRAKERAR